MNRNVMHKLIVGALIFFPTSTFIPAFAQGPVSIQPYPDAHVISTDQGTSGLWQSLRKLHTRASLIMFTAHPDDEDGGTLAYESRYVGADTNLFSLNRGEGGQNVMSSDFWNQLGLVRTQELLAADRYYGVHQYWSRVADFGFTKTKEEALQKWGYDRVLYDSVRVVRMTRPLVVTSVFAGNVSDGHGQHQVAGQMAQEVYKAAGDPTVFPDQIRAGLLPWTPLKVYVRLPFAAISSKGIYDYATGHWAPARFRNYVNDTWIEGKPNATLTIPEGQFNPIFGQSYIQVSRRGLGLQKSQNGGIGIPLPGTFDSGYHLYASRVATTPKESTFFDGIDVSLAGIASYAPSSQQGWIKEQLTSINTLVEQAMQDYIPDAPEKIAPTLAKGLAETETLIHDVQQKPLPPDARYNILHELDTKRVQFNEALVQSLGITLAAEVSADSPQRRMGPYSAPVETFLAAIPGQSFHVRVHLANQGAASVAIRDVLLVTHPDKNWTLQLQGSKPTALNAGDATDVSFSVTVPGNATITQPYFTRPTIEQPYYNIKDPAYLDLSWMPYPLSAEATFTYLGTTVRLAQVVQTMHRITGPGPVINPLIVSPAISVWVSPTAGIVPLDSQSLQITTLIHSNVKGPATGRVSLALPKGWVAEPSEAQFTTNQDGDEQNIIFQVKPTRIAAKPYLITARATYQGKTYQSGSTTVGYEGVRPYQYYRDASYRTTGVDLRLAPHLKVGYIMGTGDEVPRSLQDIGIQPEFLSAQDIASADLQQFNAIILGVRAYAARPELKTFNDRLLAYVHGGGTLIVQYNTQEFGHNYGPYPYQLSGDPEKVIDESSKVILLDPTYPALTWPNKITVHDFDGWIEERGHGFMREWDPRYKALMETHDPDQAPQKGGLLVACYGKGYYVYAGFAFYRQLPEGVPGAFRIMANLLSLSSNTAMKNLPANSGN